MKGIQVILLLLVIAIGSLVIIRLRNRLFDFLFLLLLVLAATVLIMFPDASMVLAHWLGVGRGTDLVFYVSTLAFWFFLLKLYLKQRSYEKKLTELIRAQSLQQAKPPSTDDAGNS